MILRKAEKNDYKQIKRLYLSAFPEDERAPFFFVRRRARQGRAEMLVAEENGAFIGFSYTVSYRELTYLFYFAVDGAQRGTGCGSEILRLLKERCAGSRIFLAREPLDDGAANNGERVRRRNFYLRNGFSDLPYEIREAGVIFDLMSTEEPVDPQDYDALIRRWAGRFVSRRIEMRMTEKTGPDPLSGDN